ncbi:hypothetical protein NEMIN01_2166 [Nematocida minor]|uniref:uncharacterized protein n=1 Tax=Nematocida minor TaxID=1912983 RepID=UPI00221FD8BC|nr:uncharacterized protein NEMIN01_2166 [Nematocida minor]KAI5192709.1 hypothetical protein NEMIN01_2166 [Nematocida minor]
MAQINGTKNRREPNERIKDIIPQLRKYTAQRIGGSETIRCLRDTLKDVGLKWKKTKTPYRHQKVLRSREKKEEIETRESLREQGIIIKKKENRKEKIMKKRKY